MKRADSAFVSHYVLIAITLIASIFVGQLLIEYTRRQHVSGEFISVELRASRTVVTVPIWYYLIDASIAISCNGERCEQYRVTSVEIYGYCDQCDPNYRLIGSANFSTTLRNGVTVLSLQVAVRAEFHVRFITAVVNITCPACEQPLSFHVSREFDKW